MSRIIFAESANRDLKQIGDYIIHKLKSPQAALNTVRKIRAAIDRLSDFPLIGVALFHQDEPTDFRFLVCGNYHAFYRIVDDKVLVDRILYGKRDHLSILFDE